MLIRSFHFTICSQAQARCDGYQGQRRACSRCHSQGCPQEARGRPQAWFVRKCPTPAELSPRQNAAANGMVLAVAGRICWESTAALLKMCSAAHERPAPLVPVPDYWLPTWDRSSRPRAAAAAEGPKLCITILTALRGCAGQDSQARVLLVQPDRQGGVGRPGALQSCHVQPRIAVHCRSAQPE